MRRTILLFAVAAVMAVMVVMASAGPAFAGKAYGWGANPELCEAYPGNGCGWHGHP